MKSRALLLAVAGALTALVGAAQGQERIVNGDMGLFDGPPENDIGVPNGWTSSTTPTSGSASSSTNSPFTNRYANNNLSWVLPDEPTNGQEGYIQNGYAPHAVALVNFDFNVGSIVAAGTWGVQFNNTGAPLPNVSLLQFRFDDSFNAAPWTGAGNTASADILALSANTWYNVSATLNPGAGTYSGTITPFGGSAVAFSGSISSTGLDPGGLYISGTQIRDRSGANSADNVANGTLMIDNISVVPEPAALGLLALGGVALLRRRK